LVILQSQWIKKAMRVGERFFDYKVNTALNDAVSEMRDNTNTDSLQNLTVPASVLNVVKPNVIDSLASIHFAYQRINIPHEFAIVSNQHDSILYHSKGWINIPPNAVIYKCCFSRIIPKGHYHISVWFPTRGSRLAQHITGWVIQAILFISIFSFGFIYLIVIYFKQKKLSEIKNDFVNNMTHEFKTPISTISLTSEVLINSSETLEKERIKQYAQIIHSEIQRMRKQVDQVLQMALLDKGEYDLNRTKIDIHALIRSTVRNLCLERREKDISIHYDLEAKDYLVDADPVHLTNIIVNLVDNAIKYSGQSPYISFSSYNKDEFLVFSVKDKGLGISSSDKQHIFDKFYRVPTGNIHNVKGFGIGLYYVRMLVIAHGGTIHVESELGKGSTFTTEIPLFNASNTTR
jgi:two-component system, OmpR family, phosphate regulon sensor histidine kinase PhoR